MYNKLGVEDKKVVFLFTDSHVAEEGFLELINNMLTSGMVPALYADDEKDALIGQIRDEATKFGYLEIIFIFSVNLIVISLLVKIRERN